MVKPKSMPVPESKPHNERKRRDQDDGEQESLSGSKKVKQQNHVSHHNPEG